MRKGTRAAISLMDRRLERPLLALQAAMDGNALIKAVFRLLRNAVRCDFVNVFLRFVRKGDANVAYRMVDSRGVAFSADLLNDGFFEDHPAMPHLMAHPGIRFINTREILAPDPVLHQTRFYHEVMQVVGFRHAVGLFVWDHPPHTPEAIFSLLRGEGQADFDDVEVALLDRLYAHINAAFHRVQQIERERAVRRELRGLVQRAPQAACILDWNLRVVDSNLAARKRCTQWHLGTEGARLLKPPPFRLPPPLRETCAELKARWHASPSFPRVSGEGEHRVVAHPALPGLRAKITLHPAEDTSLGKPGFLIEFEQDGAWPAPPGDAKRRGGRRALLDALSEREHEVVRLVCAGRSNQEIADHTGRALGSVKNVLHGVFKKLGVRSRANLCALFSQRSGGGAREATSASKRPSPRNASHSCSSRSSP